ncbi:MAG: DEAD/DEAH box helicase [Candidatus Izimaplasma sp.]|nr:DEAD/DEAH box helicase [Candidatus Izimaplasma bacterium]
MQINRKFIKDAIDDLGFREMTEIQEKIIPQAKNNRDIIGCSQTGSGKTHAFLIPIFENLDLDKNELQVLIAAPTRELANQIYKFASHMAAFSDTPIDIRKYTGGSNRAKEVERLEKSQPTIAIGTPGKLHDLSLKERVLKTHTVTTFIIDEADMSLESGFLTDIDLIAGTMPDKLQMMVFSATIPEKIRPFLRKYMNQPVEVYIKPKELSSLNITHIFIPIKSQKRDDALLNLLQTFKPYVALIFCNTKDKVEEIGSLLYKKGFDVIKLHGDIKPRERKRVMRDIKAAKYQYIVASDIASRGIDIDGLSHVINYELPEDMEFYIHRTGRTGRANYDGLAMSLYTKEDDQYIDFLESKDIKILYKDIKDKELITRRTRKQRFKRENVKKGYNKHKLNVKKNKKVKPGYKKKYHSRLQKARRKADKKNRS